MGADYLQQLGFDFEQLGTPRVPSSAQDTIDATAAFVEYGVDLIIFVGGDGTARDVLSAASSTIVFGGASGSKNAQRCVCDFAESRRTVVADLANGRLIDRVPREVRITSNRSLAATARDAVIRTRAYGGCGCPKSTIFATDQGGR